MPFSPSSLGFSLRAVRVILPCSKMERKTDSAAFPPCSWFLSFARQHKAQWKDERKSGTDRSHFQGAFYWCQTTAPWAVIGYTLQIFISLLAGHMVPKLPARCWYTTKGKRGLRDSLGYYMAIFLSNLWLLELCALSNQVSHGGDRGGGLIPYFYDS